MKVKIFDIFEDKIRKNKIEVIFRKSIRKETIVKIIEKIFGKKIKKIIDYSSIEENYLIIYL